MYFTQDDFKKIHEWLKRNSVRDSEFTEASDITGEEIITVVQEGTNKKIKTDKFIKTVNGESLLGEGDIEISGDTEYDSDIPEDLNLTVPKDIGGIKEGTTLKSLEGKSFSELFDNLLFPTIYPDVTGPSAYISWSGYKEVQKVGNAGPLRHNFTVNYDPGNITLQGVFQNTRAGKQDLNNSFIFVGDNPSNKQFPKTVSLGDVSFKYMAAYEEGYQPKDSKGNDYINKLPAGKVESRAIILNGTYPYYAILKGDNDQVEYLDKCVLKPSSREAIIELTSIQNKWIKNVKSTEPKSPIFKVYGKLIELYIHDIFVEKTDLLSSLEEIEEQIDGVKTGYTLYKYLDNISRGDVQIYSGKIKFKY